jgi:hypothetical protein
VFNLVEVIEEKVVPDDRGALPSLSVFLTESVVRGQK